MDTAKRTNDFDPCDCGVGDSASFRKIKDRQQLDKGQDAVAGSIVAASAAGLP
jgi:hypothetical protein